MKFLPKSFTLTYSKKLLIVLPALGAAFVLSALLGATSLDFGAALGALGSGDFSNVDARILLYVRLPRSLAAPLAGAAMAVAGALVQGVLNNPLAGPGIIGVNSGAGLGALLVAAFFPGNLLLTPLAAFLGALFTGFLIYSVSAFAGFSRTTVLLSGIAINAVFGALLDILRLLFPEALIMSTSFMIGGFSGVTLSALVFPAVLIALALIVGQLLACDLDILTLGDDTARALGMNATLMRFLILTLASLLCGAAISFGGLIGFVGLIVPHAARFFFGREHRGLLPACALLGALLVLVCDLLARVLFAPFELPCGVLLSLLGGPFFLYLLIKRKGGHAL